MRSLIAWARGLERVTAWIGTAGAWCVLLLIAVTVFDVVTRRFLVLGSTRLQELEWHLHTIVFALAMGWAYVERVHVRIDIVRDRLRPRTRAWIELLGFLLFLLPLAVALVWYGVRFAHLAWLHGEGSPTADGLPHRFLIKSLIPLGLALVGLAGLAVALRLVVFLFGPAALRDEAAAGTPVPRADPAAPMERPT